MNTTMGHLYMRRQGMQSTIKKNPETDLEENFNTNVVFCNNVGPSTTQEGKIYSELYGRFPITSSKVNK